MKPKNWLWATLFAGVMSVSTPVIAQDYTYYDLGKPKTIRLVPNLVAEVVSASQSSVQPRSASVSSIKALSPSAQLTKQGSGNVRIWKTSTAISARNLQAANAVTLSPVFQGGGVLRALAGGVVVGFKNGVTESQAKAWASSKGYAIKEKLSFGNYYLVDTPIGLTSLELANQWQASGEVVSATPNWWRQVQSK